MTATGRLSVSAAVRTAMQRRPCSSSVPCEKFNRATSRPAATSSCSSPSVAGPSVTTSLARRGGAPRVRVKAVVVGSLVGTRDQVIAYRYGRGARAYSTRASAPEPVTVWIGGHMEDCVLFDKCRPSLTSPEPARLEGSVGMHLNLHVPVDLGIHRGGQQMATSKEGERPGL
jgi:hypothetical protein